MKVPGSNPGARKFSAASMDIRLPPNFKTNLLRYLMVTIWYSVGYQVGWYLMLSILSKKTNLECDVMN